VYDSKAGGFENKCFKTPYFAAAASRGCKETVRKLLEKKRYVYGVSRQKQIGGGRSA